MQLTKAEGEILFKAIGAVIVQKGIDFWIGATFDQQSDAIAQMLRYVMEQVLKKHIEEESNAGI